MYAFNFRVNVCAIDIDFASHLVSTVVASVEPKAPLSDVSGAEWSPHNLGYVASAVLSSSVPNSIPNRPKPLWLAFQRLFGSVSPTESVVIETLRHDNLPVSIHGHLGVICLDERITAFHQSTFRVR